MKLARIAIVVAGLQGIATATAFPAEGAGAAGARPVLSADQAALKAVDDRWAEAVKNEDLDAVLALYADDAILFDPGVVQARGKDAIRKVLVAMFAEHDNVVVQLSEPVYHASGDMGYSAGLFRMTATGKSGEKVEATGRVSAVLVRKGGKWLYQVDHASLSPTAMPSPDGTVRAPK